MQNIKTKINSVYYIEDFIEALYSGSECFFSSSGKLFKGGSRIGVELGFERREFLPLYDDVIWSVYIDFMYRWPDRVFGKSMWSFAGSVDVVRRNKGTKKSKWAIPESQIYVHGKCCTINFPGGISEITLTSEKATFDKIRKTLI